MPKNQPLISVIVPVYKAERYLAACIEGILSQSYKNLEIILVDDGSPDDSGKICDSYAERDSRITVIHKENAGVSEARNSGLSVATGEFIGFVDSDDMPMPTMYEELYTNLIQSGADVSVCAPLRCTSLDAVPKVDNEPAVPQVFSVKDALYNMLLGKAFLGFVWSKLFRRSCVEELRFDPEIKIGEDLLYSAKAIMNSGKVVFTKKPLYKYLQREGSALHAITLGFSETNFTYYYAHMRIIEAARDKPFYKEIEHILDASVLHCCLILALGLKPFSKTSKKYVPTVKRAVRSHISKRSLSLLYSSKQRQARILAVSHTALHLFFRLHDIKRLFKR